MQIEVRNGSFTYPHGKEVLHNLNFSFNSSDIVAILGRNGAGKTTASMSVLPEILDCREFVNADEIAKGKLLLLKQLLLPEAIHRS